MPAPFQRDVLSNTVHRSRYHRWKKEGYTVEKIAEQDKVGVDAVRRSIRTIEAYFSIFSDDELRRTQISIVIGLAGEEKAALLEALHATKLVADVDGDTKVVPDHQTRMEAVKLINEKNATLLPQAKPGGTNVSVGVGMSVNPQPSVGPGDRIPRFEDNVREVMARRSTQRVLAAPPEEDDSGTVERHGTESA